MTTINPCYTASKPPRRILRTDSCGETTLDRTTGGAAAILLTLVLLLCALPVGAKKPTDPWLVYNPFYSKPIRSGQGVLEYLSPFPGYYSFRLDRDVSECALMVRLASNDDGLRIGAGRLGIFGPDVIDVYVWQGKMDLVDAPFDLILRCAPEKPKRGA